MKEFIEVTVRDLGEIKGPQKILLKIDLIEMVKPNDNKAYLYIEGKNCRLQTEESYSEVKQKLKRCILSEEKLREFRGTADIDYSSKFGL